MDVSNLKILHIEETCTACSACANACPRNAIQMSENHEGFYYPNVDSDLCINCKLCENICPVINATNEEPPYDAYYGYALDSNTVKSSSSGGAFHTLSQSVLKEDGVIFGAVFNYGENLRLEHRSTQEFPLQALMKSKYVQSFIGNSFRKVKELLNEGKKVMFVGTPCQINGLTSFLKKDYDNLIKVDFICHGVPSMDLLRKHLEYIGFSNLSQITKIDFRPKIYRWVDYLVVEGKKRKYQRFYSYDGYYNSFERSSSIRNSCMTCISCNGKNKTSDITLADFWAYSKAGITIPDGVKGLSLILTNTDKGKKIVEDIEPEHFKISPLDKCYAKYVYARKRDKESAYDFNVRNQFISDIYSFGYSHALKKKGKVPRRREIFIFELKNKIKKLLGRL